MTVWSYSLVWLSCLFVGEIVKRTNGDVSPPWITTQGCYDWNPGVRSKPLSDNGPTSCFYECANLTHIGIQANICVCFENMPNNPRIPIFTCQLLSHAGQHMLVYSKVTELPPTISQADYGYVYVSMVSTASINFYASNSSSDAHGVCYEGSQMKCKCVSATDNGEFTRLKGFLISYYGFQNVCSIVPGGSYWIGMFRENPDFSSTAKTPPSTNTSPLVSTSFHPSFPSTYNISSSFSQTVAIISYPITKSSSGYHKNDVTTGSPYREGTKYHEGTPEGRWKIIAAAFIAISIALLISIIAGLVAFLRKKKENQISHTDQENMKKQARASTHSEHRGNHALKDGDTENLETDKRSQNSLPLRIELHPEVEGNHLFEEQAKHPTAFQVGQTEQTLQNLEIPKKRRRHRRSHHHQEKDVTDLPGTVEDHIPDIREKKRKHRKSHHREQTDDNMSDTAMEQGQEIHRKRRKHRKSHLHAETDVTNLSDTALEHSLLDILEDDNRKRKERRKRKKIKQKLANTVEESDGINVS